jgi:hypothetical protein
MQPIHIQIIFGLISIAITVGSVYVGVKVALAEVRGDIKRHDGEILDLKEGLRRLEGPFFQAAKK